MQVCLWPNLHRHLREWEDEHTFRGVVMGSLTDDPLKPGLRSAESSSQFQVLGEEEIVAAVKKRCGDVVTFLCQGLKGVYSQEDQEMIGNIWTVLNLEDKMKQVRESVASVVAQNTVQDFLTAAEAIDPNVFNKCERAELREQYQVLVKRLEKLSQEKGNEELNTMDIMISLLDSKNKLHEGCEAVMDILTQASVMKTVESVVEFWISV